MKYTKQNIEKQRKVLSSDKVRKNSSVSLFLFKYVFIVSIILIVAGLGLGVGFVRGILKTTPQITKNSVHSKGYITTIYDNKGQTIKTEFILLCHPSPKISSMHLLPLRMNGFTAIMVLICTGSFELPSLVFVTNH